MGLCCRRDREAAAGEDHRDQQRDERRHGADGREARRQTSAAVASASAPSTAHGSTAR